MRTKIPWHGMVTSIQPRIRLMRSFDQSSHTYLGYVVRMDGQVGEESRVFTIGMGKGAQAKGRLQVGDIVSGECEPVKDIRREPAEFYKVSKLKVTERFAAEHCTPPPWHGIPEDLEIYRARGHRRLDARTYERKCSSCLWGCRMPVEIIVDQWDPGRVRYRFETFCYGPKSCAFYRPGPTRKVPGRKGMVWEEEDWIDEEATAHRGPTD